MLARIFVAFSLALFASQASAEPVNYFQVEGIAYDEGVPAYEDHAGYEIGERPVRMGEMVPYLRGLAANSDRIVVETLGYSHERRPILSFIVTSPENHANLESIRQTHLARLEGRASPEAAPMVLWLNFGVHGAETSGMEASVPVLYHFAAAQGPQVETMLDNTVLIFTVPFNPDGHTRRIDHVDTFWSYADNSDPNDAAHDLWVEARTNHYWFDLNRQWLLLTQPEAQAWIKQWHKWKPMLSVDYHEMGSNSPYYFHPGEEKRKNPLIPDRARELAYGIAERHAAYLDREKHLYTTEERFDNYYIGKGSTYPQINGSLGILFEAGAARGGAIQTERGLVKTAQNVRTQFRTALTSIQGALDLRSEITAYQRDFFVQNARAATNGGWVFTAKGDPERAARFVRLLNMHDIEVSTLGADASAGGQTFKAGDSFFVSMSQTNNRMIRGIFERVTEFEENIFYDVSGWTLPLTYDLDYAQVSRAPVVDAPASGAFQSAAAPDVAPYGYVFDWSHTYAPRALNRILSKDIMARAAMEGSVVRTTEGQVELGRGAIFVPLDRQEVSQDAIHAVMEEIAAKDGVPVYAAASGLTPVAGRDLGASNIFRIVEEPKVVLAYGDGLAYYDAGEMWWTLDYGHTMPVTLVRKSQLGRLDWSEYTHLILVGGNASLSKPVTAGLSRWIEQGGTLVATRSAAHWAEEHVLGREKEDEGREASDTPARLNFEELGVRDAEHVIGGAVFAADLDTSHPLGFGFSDRDLPVHRNVTFTLQRSAKNPYAVPVQYKADPLLSGYASERRQKEIGGTPSVVAERKGQGTVILMADNPVFRGTYPGTEKLLMNSLFFSGLIDAPRGEYAEQGGHVHEQ